MSTSPSPFGDDFLSSDQTLIDALVGVDRHHKELAPKVREMNRVLVPLLGKCSTTNDGSWAFLAQDDNNDYFIAVEPIPMDKALGIVARLSEVLGILDGNNTVTLARPSYQPDLGPSILGDVARFQRVPGTHVRKVGK